MSEQNFRLTNGVLINAWNENTKTVQEERNAVESNMVLRCQVSEQAAMKGEYKVVNASGTKRVDAGTGRVWG